MHALSSVSLIRYEFINIPAVQASSDQVDLPCVRAAHTYRPIRHVSFKVIKLLPGPLNIDVTISTLLRMWGAFFYYNLKRILIILT